MSSINHESGCTTSPYLGSYALNFTASELAIDGFGLIVSLSMAGTYLAVAFSRRHTQKVAPWWLFGVAVLFSLISFIIRLVTDVLRDCEEITYQTETSLFIAVVILFSGFGYLVWLAVLLFPLTLNVLELANMPRKQIAVGLGLMWAVTVVLWIAQLTCVSIIQVGQAGVSGVRDGEALYHAYRGLIATQIVLYLIATLIACVLLILALRKLRGVTAVSKSLHTSVYVTIAFSLASSILNTFEVFYQSIAETEIRVGTSTILGILDIIFVFGAAYGMLFVAANRTWAHQTTCDEYGQPEYVYSAVHPEGQLLGGASEMSDLSNDPVEMNRNGTSTLYPHAPTSYHRGYAQPSELVSPTVP